MKFGELIDYGSVKSFSNFVSCSHETGHLCGCTGTTVSIYNLLRSHTQTHLLLIGNDTVPISLRRSGSLRCIECPDVAYLSLNHRRNISERI